MLNITENRHEAEMIYEMTGSLDTVSAPQLRERLATLPADIRSLVLDMSRLRYVSSAGLRVIVIASEKMDEREGSFKLAHVNEFIAEVLHDTGMDLFLEIERD